ncbi:MAG: PaaI family thioesterase [Acidobacteria bacterium]|nr:PaaI family thioesterase [Acidobacteriota bacterium]
MKRVPESDYCFICGKKNPIGVKLEAYYETGKVEAEWIPDKALIGWENIIHGGIISAILDEIMVWVPWTVTGRFYFTGEMTVRFIKPLLSGTKVKATATVLKEGTRIFETEGSLTGEDGTVYATAKGKYLAMSEKDQAEMKRKIHGDKQ